MSDENERSVASAGSVQRDSLSAYLAWRDGKIASGDSDVNPFMVWSAGVRYATLTDQERSVLREVRDIYAGEDDTKCNEIAAVIDGLLERMCPTSGE